MTAPCCYNSHAASCLAGRASAACKAWLAPRLRSKARRRSQSCPTRAQSSPDSAPSNLGALQSLAAPDAAAQSFFLEQAPQGVQFSGGGPINVDGPAIAASLLVLLLLLALSFNRILGLERWLGKWLLTMREQRQYERRNEVIAARQALEQQFVEGEGEDEGEGRQGGQGPSRGGGGGGGAAGR